MKTTISSPAMWANFLKSNAELLAEELKGSNEVSMPYIDELVNNPQFITAEMATILCEIQRNAGVALNILPIFAGVMNDEQLTNTLEMLKRESDTSKWHDWIRVLGMVKDEQQLLKFWEAAPKEVKKWQRKYEPFYVDLMFDDVATVSVSTPILDMVVSRKMATTILIRLFGKRRTISEVLDAHGIRHECHEYWGDDIEYLQWHEKAAFMQQEWCALTPSVTIQTDVAHYKELVEKLKKLKKI